jgi:hypothetical protein
MNLCSKEREINRDLTDANAVCVLLEGVFMGEMLVDVVREQHG